MRIPLPAMADDAPEVAAVVTVVTELIDGGESYGQAAAGLGKSVGEGHGVQVEVDTASAVVELRLETGGAEAQEQGELERSAVRGVLCDVARDLDDRGLEQQAVGGGDAAVVGPERLQEGVDPLEGRRFREGGQAMLLPTRAGG